MFVVNKHGAIHNVTDGFQLGKDFREATEAEISAWYEMQGLSIPDTEPKNREVKNGDKSIDDTVDQPGARVNKRPRRS